MELMTPQQAKAAMDAGTAVIIDVREDAEVAQAAIPGAVHIPMSELLDRLDEVPRDRMVMFSCHSGGRSERVCQHLEDEEGFSGLVNLEGGITAWSQAGLATS
jgi:rhodanese-related sulfurtransferase